MLNGVVAQKLQSLDEILAKLRSLGQVDATQLRNDWRTRRAEFASLTAREYEDEVTYLQRVMQSFN